VSVFYSPSEKAAIVQLQSELKAVESVARARSKMLSYSRISVPVRSRSLSLDGTEFIKKEKTVEEEAAEYNQWRREASEQDLFALSKAAGDAEEVAPITTVTSPIRLSYVTMGAYSRVYKMGEIEEEDEDEPISFYGVDSASRGTNRKARHVFVDFKHVINHIARSRYVLLICSSLLSQFCCAGKARTHDLSIFPSLPFPFFSVPGEIAADLG